MQEILPWLKLAADMNPQMIETYIVGALLAATALHKPEEARAFLREGLRNNPDNSELLFDLGRLYYENFHDTNRARNIWVAALRCWEAPERQRQNEHAKFNTLCEEITMNLAHLEESKGNWPQAIKYLEMAKQVSPNPDDIQKQIDEVERKWPGSPRTSKP